MANAIQCDRCKGFYVPNSKNLEFLIRKYKNGSYNGECDLCPDCHKEFDLFMKNARIEPNQEDETNVVEGFK